MMGVGLFGLGITQINIAVALFFAAFLGEGNVTWLTYANRLIQFPMALTATAMATAMLPGLTGLALDGKHDELRGVMGFSKRVELVLMLPAMLGLMFFGMPIVTLLFERGAFTAEDAAGTTAALLYYAPASCPSAGCD
jgi:putative peptidoglycan lipid II flippase